LGLKRHVEPQYGFRSRKAVSQHTSTATVDLVSKPNRASMMPGQPWGLAGLGMLTKRGSGHAEIQETAIDTRGYALDYSPAGRNSLLACASAHPGAECAWLRACMQSSAVHVRASAQELTRCGSILTHDSRSADTVGTKQLVNDYQASTFILHKAKSAMLPGLLFWQAGNMHEQIC